MDYLAQHFPTFGRGWAALRAWYARRDLFEVFLINFCVTAGLLWGVYTITLAPPVEFPSGAYVTFARGQTLNDFAKALEDRGIIRSARSFKMLTKVFGNDKLIPSGVYYFGEPQNLLSIAIRIASGDFETTPARVTIPEGATVSDISKLLLQKLPNFDRQEFMASARGKEGYLFPDTYFFMPGDGIDAILSVFNNGFHVHLQKVQKQIIAFGKPLSDVLTMASLLEKEAPDLQSRRVIAGILWKRIEVGMPLQVDAVFPYIIGKNTFQLTLDDLKVDSPYNTYKYKSLPPGPIANPGLDSIQAAVTPIKTNYLYYLSDLQGNFHYAATYAQHLANKKKYLGT